MKISPTFFKKAIVWESIATEPARHGRTYCFSWISLFLSALFDHRININLRLEVCFNPYPRSLFFAASGLLTSAFSSTPSLLACESHRHPAFVLCFYKLLSYRYSGVGLRLPRFLFSPAYCRGPTGQED